MHPVRPALRRVRSAAWPLILAFAVLAPATPADAAAPLAPADVPEPLKPWIPWVLDGAGDARCPWVLGTRTQRCAWPSRLALSLHDRGGRFEQGFSLEREGWVSLPGDAARRPQDVLVDGAAGMVVLERDVPRIRLPAGTHTVRGTFAWDRLPDALRVPPETGLVTVDVRGRRVERPLRQPDGRLVLGREAPVEAGEQRLDVAVHRRLSDDVPARLETRVELRVSGESREAALGPALLPGFVPMVLDSPLPARLERDGRLRVQLRPGTWTLTLTARHAGPLAEARLPEAGDAAWAPEEIWAFEPKPELRTAEVTGVPAVDPQQTRMPPEWRGLSAYRLVPGSALALVEHRRGDAAPSPDQLTLQRTLWLDFDGGGLTFRDAIGGTLQSGWRLEMGAPVELGRVAVDGRDQLITRLTEAGPAGVELRRRELDVVAESRWTGALTDVPAVGWAHDFRAMGALLQLPPGWRLLHAAGVDEVPGTWLGGWTLLDLFLVLVLALAVWRLFGPAWGVLALVGLMLLFPEKDAPRWIWAFVLVGEALRRVLPAGRLRRAVDAYRLGAVVVLAGLAVAFVVGHVREGMYPVLARPWDTLTGAGQAVSQQHDLFEAPRGAYALERMAESAMPASPADEAVMPDRESLKKTMKAGLASALVRDGLEQVQTQVDPDAVVQTGPGLPRWTWQPVRLIWNGPVTSGQRLRLWTTGPWTNLVLAFVRAGLLALLVLGVAGLAGRLPLRRGKGSGAAATLLLALLLAPAAAPAQTPSPELLNELRTRLTRPPECLPECASVPALRLEARPERIALRFEVLAAAPTALPLPGTGPEWAPDQVLVDGAPARGLVRGDDGRLFVQVPEGAHAVVVVGTPPPRDMMPLPLWVRPGRVEADVRGWTLGGLHADGAADGALQLTRVATAGRRADRLEPEALPAFARVIRTLELGLVWEVSTEVLRETPDGAGGVLEVPLLPGERPVTEGLRMQDGQVLVNLAGGGPGHPATVLAWRSVLEPSGRLALTAPETDAWAETWFLGAGPMWHVETSGIPPVHRDASTALREWRPWPGESVVLDVARPAPVPGREVTVDEARLVVTPGRRATDATLTLQVRAGRGGTQEVTLPEGARVQAMRIDAVEQPLRPEGRTVALPVRPGAQTIEIEWRTETGLSASWSTPDVDLGLPAANVSLEVRPPASRWVLLLFGPRSGPAVLFWSLLVVVLLAAVILHRLGWTPLRRHEWLLLGVGLTQVPVWVGLLVAGWLLALGHRARRPDATPGLFDLRQLLLVVWTVAAVASLFVAVQQGLLGTPDMQISGNGSHAAALHWYADRAAGPLPSAVVVSAPILVYRAAMLAWALWLALALLRWLRWGWTAFKEGGLWRPVRPRVRPARGTAEAPLPARPVPPERDQAG